MGKCSSFELLPAGMVGVFFGAILAIHLSTISSHLNLGALYFTRDIWQRYINPEASEKQLTMLPGIGPSKAKAIVEYRKKHGPFRSPEDLSLVKGIGERTVELNRDDIRVAAPKK